MGKSLLLVERYNQIFLDFMIFVLNTRTMATRAKSQLANLMAYRYYVKHKKNINTSTISNLLHDFLGTVICIYTCTCPQLSIY